MQKGKPSKKEKLKALKVRASTHHLYKVRAAEQGLTVDELARQLITKR